MSDLRGKLMRMSLVPSEDAIDAHAIDALSNVCAVQVRQLDAIIALLDRVETLEKDMAVMRKITDRIERRFG